jgi:hypothetical protein
VRGPILATIPAENHAAPLFFRNLQQSIVCGGGAVVLAAGDNNPVDVDESTVNLGRAAWLVTVFACLVAVLILILNGYYGYAGVTLAVAISAGINLL